MKADQPKKRSVQKLVDHWFRHESGKLISVLTRYFGPHNMNLAEDVVQDSMLEAVQTWSYKGIPEDPSAWLYRVARNKALNRLNHQKYKQKYHSEIVHSMHEDWADESDWQHVFTDQNIRDDQLRMIFTCCHPAITPDSQVALALKTLCGFSIQEIAKAYLSKYNTINRRLVRARKQIRKTKVPFEVPTGDELVKRLQTVLETLYLMFNEGYKASGGDQLIRHDLCLESIRLTEIIVDHPAIKQKSSAHALLALMLLNASRFKARLDDEGGIIPLEKQDRSLWDQPLMNNGFRYLNKSMDEGILSPYHIMAAISACHCSAKSFEKTDWEKILSLYDSLNELVDSPLVLLNRAVALEKVEGPKKALEELQKLEDHASMKSYHLFYSTRAECYLNLGLQKKAKESFLKAIALCSLEAEEKLLRRRLENCREGDQKKKINKHVTFFCSRLF